jgi:hypothetical protein
MAQSKLVSFVILMTILLASDFSVKFEHENMNSITQRIFFHGKNGLNFKKNQIVKFFMIYFNRLARTYKDP